MASKQDQNWAYNFRRFGGKRDKYDKYFEDGQLKQGYSFSGAIGGSEKVFEHKNRGQMAGTKDARYRKPGSTFQIYKLPGQQAAPAPAPAPDPPAPLMPTISDESKKYRAETEALLSQIDKKLTDFNDKELDEQTRVRNFAIQSANQARSNQIANLQIQPASSTSKTAGTQAFKKPSNRKQQQPASSTSKTARTQKPSNRKQQLNRQSKQQQLNRQYKQQASTYDANFRNSLLNIASGLNI